MTSAPKWTPATKWVIFIICLIILALGIWRFSVVLAPLIVAVIFAYLLNPVVNYLTKRSPMKRGMAAAIVYILFLIFLALIPTLMTPLIVAEISELNIDWQESVEQLTEAMDYPIRIGPSSTNLNVLLEPVAGSLDQILSPLAAIAADLAVNIAEGFIWAIFIFVVGFYLLVDANRFGEWVDSWIPQDYFTEFKQLQHELDGVWKAYFVGQLTLALLVAVIIGSATAILGIKSALLLGIVAGLLELIPNWGYSISGTVGVIFAYFQGSTYIPLPNWAFALLVFGFYFLMWQVDTNYLVPRIIGNRLHLPPAVIIVGIIAGASVGGALGLLLAAPTIASIRVLGGYIYRRLMDLEPYVQVDKVPPPQTRIIPDIIPKSDDPVDEPVVEEKVPIEG
ncbi:MAG: AI-2E family transporter [Anaerolineae bacterium]|nr:AI-2E family transporter [Anaerolineae bacterium]